MKEQPRRLAVLLTLSARKRLLPTRCGQQPLQPLQIEASPKGGRPHVYTARAERHPVCIGNRDYSYSLGRASARIRVRLDSVKQDVRFTDKHLGRMTAHRPTS